MKECQKKKKKYALNKYKKHSMYTKIFANLIEFKQVRYSKKNL